MRVLVVYGTTEGQTRKIADHLGLRLTEAGHAVQLYDTARRPRRLHVGDFDAVAVIAAIHQKRHPEAVAGFVAAHLAQLAHMPTLFVSVSLSAAFADSRPEAQGYVDRFLADTGWRPTRAALAAGALRYSEYDFYERQIIEEGALKGHEQALAEGDRELTDWPALDAELDAFLADAGLGRG